MTKITINNKQYEVSSEVLDAINTLLENGKTEASKRWRGNKGSVYYIGDSYGNTERIYERNDEVDDHLYAIGNYFRTIPEAEAYNQRLLAEQTIRDSSDFVPDWEYDGQEKYCVLYNYSTKKLEVDYWYERQYQTLTHYPTEEAAEAALADPTIKQAYLTVFGVEEV